MKRVICFFVMALVIGRLHAQDTARVTSLESLKDKLGLFTPFLEGTKFKDVANLILNDPVMYNNLWGRVYNNLREKDSRQVLKNLNIQFKTFQANDSNKTSLGLGYNWNYDINRKKNTDYERSGFLAKLMAEGNVAFKKELNPLDFQQAKISFGRYGFAGGTVNKSSAEITASLNAINQKLVAIDDEDELVNSPLWNELTEAMDIKNHYHYELGALAGWEGSQDFKKSQLTYGAQFRVSAKAYSNRNALAQLNVLDYPFALIRYLTGTDGTIEPYGASLPIVTFGIDMVNPSADEERKVLTGNEDQFARFRFEAGFRTLMADVKTMPIYFNAAFRYFNEFNAPGLVKQANLNRFSYFTCSISGSDTYFASYSYGKLPFDRTTNAIYELGFKLGL
ncbi:MAG: hypothetical protein JWQ96_1643 [Segetibacter sp.]|nr:hypothetical protein [Segetibacter sp.]